MSSKQTKSTASNLPDLTERIPLPAIFIDAEWFVRAVNQKFVDLLGLKTTQIVDRHIADLQPYFGNALEESLEKIVPEKEMRLSTATGEKKWVVCSVEQEGALSQQAKGYWLIFYDITKLKKRETAIIESETHFAAFFNAVNDAYFIYEVTPEGHLDKLIDANNAALRILGYPYKILKSLPHSKIFSINHWEKLIANMQKTPYHLLECNIYTADGSVVPVEVGMVLSPFKQRQLVLLAARDITKRRNREQQLWWQAKMLEKAQDAIWAIDANDLITFWNSSAAQLYGMQESEVLGNNCYELIFPPNSNEYRNAKQATLVKGEWHGELKQLTKNRDEIIVESRWTLIREGEYSFMLIVNSDITEKKQLETQFLRAQRMESIGALAGGIAHDLNNILTPILTSVQILEMRVGDDEKNAKVLRIIENNVTRGVKMIKHILAFARGGEPELRVVYPNELIDEVALFIRNTFPTNIRVVVSSKDDIAAIMGDYTQLYQVLVNLSVNAQDAMPNGGTLKLSAENVRLTESDARKILEAKPGDYVCLTVEDNGVGIPKELITQIFEPFFTTKPSARGSGLGLPTALGIIRRHRGFIAVDSTPGTSTAFKVYFPVIEKKDPASPPDNYELYQGNHNEIVLMVDDDDGVVEIAKMALTECGYKVLIAENGVNGLSLFQQNYPDVKIIITDMMMPEMDGNEMIERIHAIDPKVPIIATSGFVDNEAVMSFIEKRQLPFLQKPYKLEDLLGKVRELLNKSRTNTTHSAAE
jgi:PAS domain S-box-containing protein